MRKTPRQARSRATVDVILAAGAQLLGEVGWPKFTTNQLAEVAGVSIGSLYQYFPNKTVLVDAITRRHFEDVLGVLREIEGSALSLDGRVERLVDGMIRIHGINPPLHRVLLHDVPTGDALKSAHAVFETEYIQRYETLIASDAHTQTGPSDTMAAEVLSAAVAGVIHDAAQKGTLASPALRRELIALVLAYVRDRRSSGRKPQSRIAGGSAGPGRSESQPT